MSDSLKVAIVGLGRIASGLEDDHKREKPATHAGAFARVPGVVLAAGCDQDPARRQAFQDRWGVGATFTDAQQMLDEVKPDIFVVATHPDSHAHYIEAGVRSGVPVIVGEKPLTDSLSSARRVVRLVGASTTRLIVNHERRYARDWNRVRQLIDSDSFGRLRSISCKLFMGRGRTPGEVLVWDGTHLIDVLRFLTDAEVRSIWASGNPEMPGSSLQVGFSLKKAEVFIELACDRDHLVFEADLSWERGRVRIGNGLYEEFEGAESPLYDNFRSLVARPIPKDEIYPSGYFVKMAQDAVRCAREPGAQPISGARDGLAALEAIDKILHRVGSSLRAVAKR